ncbi:MAG: hypothetical protein Q4D38_14590 [Planctomycetia bacterium]|nr:hypothetical protein [Planctomycetia bacterium]
MMTKNLPAYAFFALMLVCSSVFSSEPAPQTSWIFNHGPDLKRAKVAQGALLSEVGLMKILPTGSDLTLSVPIYESDRFSAEERPIFALRYRYDTRLTSAALFFATNENPTLCDKQYVVIPVTGDRTWRTATFDMRCHKLWKGTILNFRLDPTNPSDMVSTIEISRMGFFATESEATAFLAAADDRPDYTSPSIFSGNKQRVLIPGNTLSDGFRREEYMLQNQLSASEIMRAPEVVVERDGERLPLCDTNALGFTVFEAARSGVYRVRQTSDADTLADIAGHANESAIRFVVARGLMNGVDAAHFDPDAPLATLERKTFQEKATTLGLDGDLPQGATRAEAAEWLCGRIKKRLGTFRESPYPNEFFARKRLRIGAWCNFNRADVDEKYMREYADAGFDWVIDTCGISAGERKNDFFRWCNQLGIEVIVNDGAYQDPENLCAEYFDQPCVTGHYITDEPGTDRYPKLAEVCNPYVKNTGKTPFINLLPMYANAAQLKFGAGAAAIEYYDSDPDLYRKYCASFCDQFDTTYICTDIYPLNWSRDGKKTTYNNYIESINIIATEARRHKREFWCCIQTFAWTPSKRTPTEAEFRWQCYSLMSFGCTGILCWNFAGWGTEFPSLVNYRSEKMPSWYNARTVFRELRALSPIFIKYQNIGAFTHLCTNGTPYLKMSGEYADFRTIQEIQCDNPLLVGCFAEEKTGDTAFTLVNMAELEGAAGAQARIRFEGKNVRVTAYYRGVPEVLTPANDGLYDFYLTSGEGVFVTIENIQGRKSEESEGE